MASERVVRFGSCVGGSVLARVESTLLRIGRVLSCVRPVDAARPAADSNAIRGTGFATNKLPIEFEEFKIVTEHLNAWARWAQCRRGTFERLEGFGMFRGQDCNQEIVA